MMQTVFGLRKGEAFNFAIPNAEEILLDDIHWGRHEVFFTPAYWASQTVLADFQSADHRLGRTLHQEVAACLLGGHGIPAEIGLAAFDHLRRLGLLDQGRQPTIDNILAGLSQPLRNGNKTSKYRFARQKACYLSPLLCSLDARGPDESDDLRFRSWFLDFKGIGPKTASWITRNWLGSNRVAILDIHIKRAGLICGVFSPSQQIEKDYFAMERQFIRFAAALGVEPSHLDAVIWVQMKEAGDSIFPLVREISRLAA